MAKSDAQGGVFHEEIWVYAGRVFYKGSLFQRFFKDRGRGEESIYKRTRATVVGGLYCVQVNEAGSVKPNTRYDGASGHPLTTEWMAQDVKSRGEKMIVDRAKRDVKFNHGAWTLDDVNQAYLKARGAERAALLAFVVAYVMNEV